MKKVSVELMLVRVIAKLQASRNSRGKELRS